MMLLMIIGSWMSVWGYGDNTSYVLEDLSEREFLSPNNTGNYTVNGPAHTLTFQAKRTRWGLTSSNNGNFFAQYSTNNGSNWTDVKQIDLPDRGQWYDFSCIIPENTTHIRFIEKTGGGGYKQVQNVRVTRATNITATTTSIDFGTRTINDASIAKTASFTFNNTTYNQQVAGSCSDSQHFTVSSVDVGATGSSSVNVTYSSSTPGVHTGTVTLSMNGATTTFSVNGSSTATYNFSATATPNNSAFGTASATVAASSITSTNASEQTTATFTATANNGYEFAGWGTTQDATSYESTANPYSTTITNSNPTTPSSTANKTLYAIFKPVFNFTATTETKNGGYGQATASVSPKILGEPSATSMTNQATFTAIPNDNCTFEGWYRDAAYTEKVSDQTTYTEAITNNQVGSTANLTLYAWFKTNQTLTFSATTYDKNIVLGTTVEGAATATASSGLPVSYKSSNKDVVRVSTVGDVTGMSVANEDIIITAYQDGDDEYNPASSITRAFHVISKIETTFTPSEGFSETIHVEDQYTITVTNAGEGFTWESTNPAVVSLSKSENIITLKALKEGTSTITLRQPETTTHSLVTKTYNITVKKVENTLQLGLATQSAPVDGSIQVYTSKKNNTVTPIEASITEQMLSTTVNNGENVITYENGIITARNAGTAKITFTQAATDKYEGFTSTTFDITVTKIPNPVAITLNGGSATAIKLKYGETATLSYTTVHNDAAINVTRTSGSYTTLTGDTITAGNEAGTDLYEIAQAETYKYEEGYASFSIRVNNTSEEEGYVLNESTQYSHGAGSGVIHTYTLSGPGNTLYYQARTQTAAIYYHLYVEYSIDGNSWTEAQDNQSLSDSYKDFSCSIPEEARYVRFRLPGGGTLSKYIRNVKIPRVTYIRATTNDATELGTVYTDETRQLIFTVNYSTTNGGNITLNSSNNHFVTNVSELTTTNHSDGTKTFTVTYTPSPDALGAESAVITISDLFYSQQFTLTATADKRENTLMVIENRSMMVDDEVSPVYSNKNSDATLSYSLSKEGVITYDANTNMVKAVGAGEATLSFTQDANDTHYGTTKRVTFTVSKYDQELSWNYELSSEDRTLKIGDKLTTNTATANSGLTVTYTSSNNDVLQVDPTTGEITALKGGSNIAITATQSGNYKYNEAPSITRYFTVISKIDATVVTTLSDTEINTLTLGDEAVSIGSNATLTMKNFSISGNEAGYVTTSFADNTLNITPAKVGGTVTITLTRAEDDGYNAINKTFSISVQGPALTLSQDAMPDVKFPGTKYREVTINRTLPAGLSTIALPFNTTVQQIVGEGYDAATDWIAQLSIATYNAHDGWSLYFEKIETGNMLANQPYILHLGNATTPPVFHQVTVEAPEAAEHSATGGASGYEGWKMVANYTPHLDMEGKYGVVNDEECLKIGDAGSFLRALTAAIIAPTTVQQEAPRCRFVVSGELNAILEEDAAAATPATEYFDFHGRRITGTTRGIYISRDKNGVVRKVLAR